MRIEQILPIKRAQGDGAVNRSHIRSDSGVTTFKVGEIFQGEVQAEELNNAFTKQESTKTNNY